MTIQILLKGYQYVMNIVQLAAYGAVHSSVYFGEPNLITKFLLACAVLLVISLLIHALLNAICAGMRLYR